MKKLKQVKAKEIIDSEPVYNLAASAATDDWIRAGRLLQEGKIEEYEAMDAQPMFYRSDELMKKITAGLRKKKGKPKQ